MYILESRRHALPIKMFNIMAQNLCGAPPRRSEVVAFFSLFRDELANTPKMEDWTIQLKKKKKGLWKVILWILLHVGILLYISLCRSTLFYYRYCYQHVTCVYSYLYLFFIRWEEVSVRP